MYCKIKVTHKVGANKLKIPTAIFLPILSEENVTYDCIQLTLKQQLSGVLYRGFSWYKGQIRIVKY